MGMHTDPRGGRPYIERTENIFAAEIRKSSITLETSSFQTGVAGRRAFSYKEKGCFLEEDNSPDKTPQYNVKGDSSKGLTKNP